MAYYEMIGRDRSRLADARARMNQCPLGAAALAGTGFPIDRVATAKALGFDGPTANSLDSVSDRDFALDFLMAAAQCSLHLSRLAEEFIIWASQPFRVRDPAGQPFDWQFDHAAEEEPRCGGTGARAFGADRGLPDGA